MKPEVWESLSHRWCLSWVKRVILTVHRPPPVYPYPQPSSRSVSMSQPFTHPDMHAATDSSGLIRSNETGVASSHLPLNGSRRVISEFLVGCSVQSCSNRKMTVVLSNKLDAVNATQLIPEVVDFDNSAFAQCAPFNVHDVVQVVVLPPMQNLQTLTHWLICFAS